MSPVISDETLSHMTVFNNISEENGVNLIKRIRYSGNLDKSAASDSAECRNDRKFLLRKQLLRRRDLPSYLQFNPYIETGYRPLLTSWECILSLFYLHNETVNILTHGVPMLFILTGWPYLLPWKSITISFLPWVHLVSSVSPWVGSTIYHLFMNHKSGPSLYNILLSLDMFGIWIIQSFGALTTVYASVSCMESGWIWKYLFIYCLVSAWCLYKASSAQSPWDRRFCFSLPVLMRALSLAIRTTSWGGGHPDAIRHVFLQDVVAVVGGFVGALRVPEKWLPGRLDFLANSHHIMHVLVVYAVYHLHQGAVLDMLWLSGEDKCLAKQNMTTPVTHW